MASGLACYVLSVCLRDSNFGVHLSQKNLGYEEIQLAFQIIFSTLSSSKWKPYLAQTAVIFIPDVAITVVWLSSESYRQEALRNTDLCNRIDSYRWMTGVVWSPGVCAHCCLACLAHQNCMTTWQRNVILCSQLPSVSSSGVIHVMTVLM
jgi:hypothetical protein